MATTVLGLKTFASSDPVDYNEINDNYNKIDTGVKTALQGRAAHNLLDNSDFTNPVNQRGATSYTTNGYTVDRWAIDKWSNDSSVSTNLSVNTEGVNLSGGVTTESTPSSCYLYQKIDCTRFAGKTLTAAVYINSLSGNGTGILGAYNNSTYIKGGNLKAGLNLLVFDVPASATVLMINIGNDASHAGKGSITASIRWAALYEGAYTADTLPAYQPKGYAAELAECQRYYYQSWTGSSANIWDGMCVCEAITAKRLTNINFPQIMRISTPSITIYSPKTGTAGKVSEFVSDTEIENITPLYTSNHGFLPIVSEGFEVGKHYCLHYSVSADL